MIAGRDATQDARIDDLIRWVLCGFWVLLFLAGLVLLALGSRD